VPHFCTLFGFSRVACAQVDDVEGIKAQGINPLKVASLLVEVFAEMVFCHGHLHGDPHPGNVLIRKADLKHPSGRDFELGEPRVRTFLPAPFRPRRRALDPSPQNELSSFSGKSVAP